MHSNRWSLASFLSFALLASSAFARDPIPETRVGRVLQEFIDAFNSGERSKLQTFFETHGPDWLPKLDGLAKIQGPTGGVDVVSIGRQDATFIEWVERTRNDHRQFMGMMEISQGAPVRLSHLRYAPIEAGSEPVGFAVDAETRRAVVEGVAAKLNETYVFPRTAAEMAKVIRASLRKGRYDSLSDGVGFSEALTKDLLEVSHDKHLGVAFSPTRAKSADASPTRANDETDRSEALADNCGFRRAELLTGNIGYLKFDSFWDPKTCSETAIAAMRFVSHADAIIFDLRENGGGDPAMVAFISTYLFSEATHLNDLWTRVGDQTQQFWTLPYVPGDRIANIPAYVLTSANTFSGAEEFTNNLKTLKRATIVGETTGGGAHPAAPQRIDDRFTVVVPFARAINPVTHSNWEGRGVEPDVAVAASTALEKALVLAHEEIAKRGPRTAAGH